MIDIQSVNKVFALGSSTVDILDDVSLQVPRSSITGVIGPSGAGKTTLLRCVNRLETPDSGDIVVDGTTVTGPLKNREVIALRRKIGMVFQSSSLLAHRTAAGNIAYPLEVHGVDRARRRRRIDELLDRVGLSRHAGSYPSELSGGQRQRVGIARALALNPPVLLADEATSGLDPTTTASILSLLRELRDDLDLTILLITHEMDVVRRACDRATLLRDGRVIDGGVVSDLAADPDSELGRQLFAEPMTRLGDDDEVELSVRLGRSSTGEEWLAELTVAVGVRPKLMAASIEAIGGRTVGVARITVPADAERDCRKWLWANGIHVQEMSA
ncbi:methionine ABC transporter ATP-binding protein [Mycolicibacterium wolinskyi]|uniref:methionine ABC transporter ATP-binding protein n=1 Tax=Mycolicibacterium wolinskyi TaxID=59750 RepID=UPI0039176F4A